MALSVASGTMVVIIMDQGKLLHWVRWREMAASPTEARSAFRVLVAEFNPDVIVCEYPDGEVMPPKIRGVEQ